MKPAQTELLHSRSRTDCGGYFIHGVGRARCVEDDVASTGRSVSVSPRRPWCDHRAVLCVVLSAEEIVKSHQ